ncbi:hypothetical protein [Mycoplasma leonicaptivi]|uniref:hypothetical protein n=1 Tax=Mycoplasma leonicaptivi TaxID=36742 RepID=UPI000482BA63|nr:hypothetical protein [Mycoplasma leonicaptivi]
MSGYKRKVIIWTILAFVALCGIIALSIFVSVLDNTLSVNSKVLLDNNIVDLYNALRSYSIGGLAFSCLIFLLGTVISYSGIKSWKYAEQFN